MIALIQGGDVLHVLLVKCQIGRGKILSELVRVYRFGDDHGLPGQPPAQEDLARFDPMFFRNFLDDGIVEDAH